MTRTRSSPPCSASVCIDFTPGIRFAADGAPGEHPVHDTITKTYRHLNFLQHECVLQVRTPRVKLPDGRVVLVKPPFAGKLSGFTLLFEALVLMLAPQMPFAAVARIVGLSAHRVLAICKRYVALALQQADYSQVKALAIDETSRSRGHDYITLAADADGRLVLAVVEGRDAKAVATIAAELAEHGCPPESIESVSIDMSPAYILGCTQELPNARITNDQVPCRLACQRSGGQDAAHRAAQQQVSQGHALVAAQRPRQAAARGSVAG